MATFFTILQRFQWGEVVLTTDSMDGHRSGAFYFGFRSHLCPSMESVLKTGLSFDMIMPEPSHPQGIILS